MQHCRWSADQTAKLFDIQYRVLDTLSLLSPLVRGIQAHISSQYSQCVLTCMPDLAHDELYFYTRLSLYTRQPHTADALTQSDVVLRVTLLIPEQNVWSEPRALRGCWTRLQGEMSNGWMIIHHWVNNVWLLWRITWRFTKKMMLSQSFDPTSSPLHKKVRKVYILIQHFWRE